jgi:glycosyltransferase involved in cell wall biosynthesis
MNPLVSIIIPTFNRASLISETLESIISQTYKNWECIVVDDGSLDKTSEVVQEYVIKDSRFQYYSRPQDRKKGANACRNYGFEMSKGKYIQWFDSDDLMHQDKLKLKVEALENNDVDFVVCEGIEYRDTIENIIRHWNEIQSNNVLLDHITGKAVFGTNGPMFKRDFLKNLSLFNENLIRKQEWEFFSRLLTYSVNYMPLNKGLYYIRSHENSINGLNELSTLDSRILSNKLVFKIAKNNLNDKDLMIVRKQFVSKYILFFKLTKQSNKTNLMFLCVVYGLSTMTPRMIFNGAIKSCRRIFK